MNIKKSLGQKERQATPKFFKHAVWRLKRVLDWLKSSTGWSLSHMANIYARLEDGDRAFECLEILSRAFLGDNFFTYHNN